MIRCYEAYTDRGPGTVHVRTRPWRTDQSPAGNEVEAEAVNTNKLTSFGLLLPLDSEEMERNRRLNAHASDGAACY